MVSRQLVVAGCYAPEALEPVSGFDAPAKIVQTLAKAEWLFPVAAVWDDELGSLLVQVLAQLGAAVGLIAELWPTR